MKSCYSPNQMDWSNIQAVPHVFQRNGPACRGGGKSVTVVNKGVLGDF